MSCPRELIQISMIILKLLDDTSGPIRVAIYVLTSDDIWNGCFVLPCSDKRFVVNFLPAVNT